MNGNQLQDRLLELGETTFPASLAADLESRGAVLSGILLNNRAGRYDALFGKWRPRDLTQVRAEQYWNSNGPGYRVMARRIVPPGLGVNADIFLFSDDSLGLEPSQIDALLVHELSHWYIDSGQRRDAMEICAEDRNMGGALFDTLDLVNGLKPTTSRSVSSWLPRVEGPPQMEYFPLRATRWTSQ